MKNVTVQATEVIVATTSSITIRPGDKLLLVNNVILGFAPVVDMPGESAPSILKDAAYRRAFGLFVQHNIKEILRKHSPQNAKQLATHFYQYSSRMENGERYAALSYAEWGRTVSHQLGTLMEMGHIVPTKETADKRYKSFTLKD